jgi:polysaccharide chain length determinant protein (PEP-CTERM system associated)
MVPGRQYNVRYVVRALRKRWWQVVLPVFITGTLGILIARGLPNVYYAQTTIVIVPQRIPQSYVRSTVTLSIAERLAATSQQVQSRSVLEPLITELNIYPTLRSRVPIEPLIMWFRRGITIRMATADSFVVGYGGYDPERVQQVAERLAQIFIRESMKEREMLADSTSQFLETELKAASERLQAQEKRVEDYRKRYAGQLPSQLEANLRILQGTSAQLNGVVESLNRERVRREEIVRELSNIAPPATAIEEPEVPAVTPENGSEIAIPAGPVSRQLRAARAMREKMQLRFTAEHPDMKRIEVIIAGLEKVAAAYARPVPSGESPQAVVMSTREVQLRDMLKTVDNQIAAQQAAEKKLRDGIAVYQGRVESVPERESEWAALTRDYTTLQGVYSDLLAKREESRIAANLEKQQVGEQFRIVERPTRPTRPVSPNRPFIVLVALALGGGVGLALLVLHELRDRGLHAESEIEAALRLPIVGLVPMIVTSWDRRRVRRRRLLWSLAALALVAGVTALRMVR